MERITLYTRDGHKVTEIMMPVFDPRAEAIQWGSRIFVYQEAFQEYREGLLFVVPTT